MKKLLLSLLALLMLVGCSNNTATTATTEPVATQEATVEPTEETIAVEELYTAFIEAYYNGEHSSDYYASSSPYVFVDAESADLKLIGKKMECEAVTDDEATLASLQEIQTAAVEEFKTIVTAVAPTYDETVSFDNNKIVIILKNAEGMCYFAADGTMKIVMGDARGTYRITEEEINSLVSFLDANLSSVSSLAMCKAAE